VWIHIVRHIHAFSFAPLSIGAQFKYFSQNENKKKKPFFLHSKEINQLQIDIDSSHMKMSSPKQKEKINKAEQALIVFDLDYCKYKETKSGLVKGQRDTLRFISY
jgi:hypothetical protein